MDLRAVLVLWAFAATCVRGQMRWPFLGRNSPPEGRTLVTVDIFVDSIESINSNTNSWTANVWFHLVWNDTRANDAIAKATANWVANDTCESPCDWTGLVTAGCCDDVFLPMLEVPNIVAVKQEMVYWERVWTSSTGNGLVHWSVRVSADFHSPYDFRAWPFEHQHLLIEMQIPPAAANRMALQFGTTTLLQNTPHTKGDVVQGWRIANITQRVYNATVCYLATNTTSTIWGSNENGSVLIPLRATDWQQPTVPLRPLQTTLDVALADCQIVAGGTNTGEGLAQYSPSYLVLDIMVRRATSYYVLAHIVPLVLLAYMSFVTYAMERTDLEARMGVIVTLVLAVSALQFTWDFPPATYLNSVQQITLMSYVLYFLIAIESMLTANICRYHARKREKDQLRKITHQPTGFTNTSLNISTARTGSDGKALPTVLETATSDGQESPAAANAATAAVTAAARGVPVADSTAVAAATTDAGRSSAPKGFGRSPLLGVAGTNTSRLPPGPVGEGFNPLCWSSLSKRRSASPESDDIEDPTDKAEKLRNSSSSTVATSMMSDEEGKRVSPSRWGLAGPPTAFSRVVSRHISSVTQGTKAFHQKLSKDEAFAMLFASRLDMIFCWSLLVGYTVTMAVLLYINSQVGDHKLILAGSSAPANM